jgi:phosphate:Na+ symporter
MDVGKCPGSFFSLYPGALKLNLFDVLFQTIGGLGIFILGMNMMADGLKMSAGTRIKSILCTISSNRIVGCITGTLVTAVVQSSSATTVMLIGFVSAGLISLQQAVGVILGANIGTTVTSQLIAFKLTSAALPAIGVGVALKFFSKNRKLRYLGEVVLGFGLLFFGMTIMKAGLSPIKSDPSFVSVFTHFDPGITGGLFLSVVTGAVLTIMVQSSSATVGLTMALATQGLLSFPGAMALVLGENIGTTITAELATIGTRNINAHRAARAHTMFNVIGVGIMLLIFPQFVGLVESITGWLGYGAANQVVNGEAVNIARYIANGHTMFNLVNAMIFLMFLPVLIKAAILLSPREKETDGFKTNLNHIFDDSPIAALAQVRSEIVKMARLADLTLRNTVECMENRNCKRLGNWKPYEEQLDLMKQEITTYLTKIYQGNVTESEAREVASLMRMTNNIEKIGDSVENLAKLTNRIIEEGVEFTSGAIADMKRMAEQVIAFFQLVTRQISKRTEELMERAEEMEDCIDRMREEMRQEHIEGLRNGRCDIEPGLIFIDMLGNFEKIGDYCFNIAEAVTGRK